MLEVTLRVANSSNVATTGLTGTEIKFRASPFGSGDVITIAGVSGSANGVYLCSCIGVAYQAAQLWISGVYQSTWGTKYIGDEKGFFVDKTTAQTIAGAKVFSDAVTLTTAGSTANHAVKYSQVALLSANNALTGTNTFSGTATILNNPARYDTARDFTSVSVYTIPDMKWIQDTYGTGSGTSIGINDNRLIVDSKQTTDIAGRVYNGIQEAISYASTQTPSSTSRWSIIIMPHHSTGYAEDITIPRFVDLIGWGTVYITGGLTTTHVTTSQTWTARDARMENLVFNSTDKNYFIRLLHVRNCIFKANGAGGEVSMQVNGSQLINTGLFSQNDVDEATANTEQENRIVNCFGNTAIVWQSTDKIYSFDYDAGDLWEF